jgi:hypothetical protein
MDSVDEQSRSHPSRHRRSSMDLSVDTRHHEPHLSISTAHSRDPSQISIATSSHRLSHGPLSLTADRYRGANGARNLQVPRGGHRRRPDLSIDTTLSRRSYRSSFGLQWHSPLLNRSRVPQAVAYQHQRGL